LQLIGFAIGLDDIVFDIIGEDIVGDDMVLEGDDMVCDDEFDFIWLGEVIVEFEELDWLVESAKTGVAAMMAASAAEAIQSLDIVPPKG
jgi:hypothetical protein